MRRQFTITEGWARALTDEEHMIVLDGTWRKKDGELAWEGLGYLGTSEVGRGAGTPGPARGETPSPERLAPDL